MKVLLLFLLLTIYPNFSHSKIDSSSQIFLPPEQSQYFSSYQQIPITWWNFLIYDESTISRSDACNELNYLEQSSIFYNPCRNVPISEEWLKNWGWEQTLFSQPPTPEQLQTSLNKTIVQLSLPLPSKKLNLLRLSPLSQFDNFSKTLFQFFKEDSTKGRWKTLPFLLNFPASNSEDLESWMDVSDLDSIVGDKVLWMGPHMGVHHNKSQIITDLTWVMILGGSFIFALIIFLIISSRKIFFLLAPIIGISVGLATFGVHIAWGSIHGLTLAFGSGLVGISMDYAFHGWKSDHDSHLWKSNFISFLTTLICFALLSLFSSPLVQQISVFAVLGLTTSFALCFWASKYSSGKLSSPNLNLKIPFSNFKGIVLILSVLLIFALASLMQLKTDFSLQRMDSAHVVLSDQVFNPQKMASNKKMHFILSAKNNFSELKEIIEWTKTHSIPSLNPASFFNEFDFSSKKELWINRLCSHDSDFSSVHQGDSRAKLFKEFFGFFNCKSLQSNQQNYPESITQLFSSDEHTLSILKVSDANELAKVKSRFPNSFSLSLLTEDFPKTLEREAIQFLGITFLAIFLFLSLFFMGRHTILTFIPALGAFCGVTTTLYLYSLPLSFISLISIIILLGLTLDYGIFCTAHILRGEKLDPVFGSISLSSITSIAGFAPLAICAHPVLRDMGVTILSGLLGALTFTFLGYSALSRRKGMKQ